MTLFEEMKRDLDWGRINTIRGRNDLQYNFNLESKRTITEKMKYRCELGKAYLRISCL